jgi:succinylglutamate desuccinylase/aspartoacylase family protein
MTDQWTERAGPAGFRLERFGEAGGVPQLALTRRTPGPRPRLYLSAGIHGDEPAPPLALLALMDAGIFDARADWFICPLLNPTGFRRQTRENFEGIDLNRDYRSLRSAEIRAHVGWLRRQPNFDLTLCLHEDWEATGFYLYELNSRRRPTLAERIVAAVSAACPIEPSELIDGRPARAGILRPAGDPLTRELWPEAIYLAAHHSTLGYTLETPSGLPLPQRIAAMSAAVTTALNLSLGAQPVAAKGA